MKLPPELLTLSAGMPTTGEPAPRLPINRVAARVTQGGESHRFANRGDEVCIHTPLPLRRVPTESGCPDLTGQRVGRLIVVGLTIVANNPGRLNCDPFDKKKLQKGGARWLCRCDCGMYAVRSTRGLRINGDEDACYQCRELRKMKDPPPGCRYEKLK